MYFATGKDKESKKKGKERKGQMVWGKTQCPKQKCLKQSTTKFPRCLLSSLILSDSWSFPGKPSNEIDAVMKMLQGNFTQSK